jgi:hypothetical protein
VARDDRRISAGVVTITVWPYLPPAQFELSPVHNSTAESVAALIDPKLLWVTRPNRKYQTILFPRYASQAEAECVALGLTTPMSGRARKQARAAAIVDPALVGAAGLSVSLEQGWRAAFGPPFFVCELYDERQGASTFVSVDHALR